MTNNYDQRNIDTMERVYGRGYMSAGGDNEIIEIFSGIATESGTILDLGCGLGGASVAIAKFLNPDKVIGLDVDEALIERASSLVNENNLEDKVQLETAPPGDLPYQNNSIDLVHCTAVSCHIEHLSQFFGEIYRVLKPGGWLLGSEWMIGAFNDGFQNFDQLLRDRGLNFFFVQPDTFTAALEESGFTSIMLRDRTEAFTGYSQIGLSRVNGELKKELSELLGEEGFESLRLWSQIRLDGLLDGGLLQQHFRAQKNAEQK